MENNVYEKLIDWLVTTFRALPGINTPEFRELVEFLYTPQEALLAVQMGQDGGKLDELLTNTGMKKEDLEALIESMMKKGTMFREPGSDNPTYRPLGVELPGLFDTSAFGDPNNPFKKQLLKHWGKFKTIYINEGIAGLGKHSVAWCMVGALPPDAKPEENLFEQLKKSDYISVHACPCRNIEQRTTQGTVCDCILDCCLLFGKLAHWAVEQGDAREINYEEAVEILKACEERGQMHAGSTNLIVCNCCKHACVNILAMNVGKPHNFYPNHFYSVVDSKTCVSCGTCVERCPVNAMRLETTAMINLSECIGCGACATGCEEGAIRMVRRSEEEIAKLDAELAAGFGRMLSMTQIDPLVQDILLKS